MPEARERFIAKCEFMPGSGCVLWRGGTTSSRDRTERVGVFWDKGRKHLARRWAAEHIHAIDLFGGKEVHVTCGDALCVQHVKAFSPLYPNRQFYVLRDLGYCDFDERAGPDHGNIPFHDAPAWMREDA